MPDSAPSARESTILSHASPSPPTKKGHKGKSHRYKLEPAITSFGASNRAGVYVVASALYGPALPLELPPVVVRVFPSNGATVDESRWQAETANIAGRVTRNVASLGVVLLPSLSLSAMLQANMWLQKAEQERASATEGW